MERDEKDKSIVRLSLTVLVDDNICREGLLGAHGLSLFLSLVDRQGEKYHILFDVGPDSELLKINSEILGLNLRRINHVVISSLINHHSSAFFEKNSYLREILPIKVIIRSIQAFHQNNNILNIGDISLKVLNLRGLWNERALLIPHVKGWIALLGCSVHGLEWSLKLLGNIVKENIYALIGGFGLSELDTFSFKILKEFVNKRNVKLLVPLHSTANNAKEELRKEFKNITPKRTGVGQNITI